MGLNSLKKGEERTIQDENWIAACITSKVRTFLIPRDSLNEFD